MKGHFGGNTLVHNVCKEVVLTWEVLNQTTFAALSLTLKHIIIISLVY